MFSSYTNVAQKNNNFYGNMDLDKLNTPTELTKDDIDKFMNDFFNQEIITEFIYRIKRLIRELETSDNKQIKNLELLAFSILCMLDGVDGSFSGDITKLEEATKHTMLHDVFYSK